MKAIAPALLFVPAMSAYRGYFQGRQDMTKIAVSQVAEQFFRVVLGLTLAYLLMKSLGQTFGAAGAISGATIGSIASMLYLVFAYMLGRKERRAEIDASQRFKDERVSYIFKSF